MKDKRIIIEISEYKPNIQKGIPRGFIQKTYHLKCHNCKKIFTLPPKRFNQGIGMFCSKSCASAGKFNSNWRGGMVFSRTPSEKGRYYSLNAKLKRERGVKCEICGYERFERALEVHHIVSRRKNGEDSWGNLILICANCHRLITSGNKTINSLKKAFGSA